MSFNQWFIFLNHCFLDQFFHMDASSAYFLLKNLLCVFLCQPSSFHRVVSGIELPQQKYSFLGTLTFNRNLESLWKPTITCTVSVITPFWAISAAHCLGKKSELNLRYCVKGANCSRNNFGDFVYKPIEIKSHIRLGISNFYNELADAKTYEIEKIIRPRRAYPR